MRIEVVGDGHVFQGTPQQILMQMKSLAFGAEHMSMREYIEGNVTNIARGFGITFKLTGETDEELAESFLQQMLEAGTREDCRASAVMTRLEDRGVAPRSRFSAQLRQGAWPLRM